MHVALGIRTDLNKTLWLSEMEMFLAVVVVVVAVVVVLMPVFGILWGLQLAASMREMRFVSG